MSDSHKQGKVTQQENQLVKELTLLTYVVRTLVDEIKALRSELKNTKIVQVPYPVYTPPPAPLTPQIPQRPYIGDPPYPNTPITFMGKK